MKQLRIGSRFELPVDVAGEAIAILAKRGAGKTNTATVLVEELQAAHVQTVIVDPVGAWWGIRFAGDGKKPGLRIPILGGQHGDVALEQTAGALIADVVVDAGQSLLLDLSDFPSKAAVTRFVTDFAERLYRRKGRSPELLHLVLEEADEFAPQGQRAETARMRGAIEQIVRRGRSRGLGVTLVTQRSAVLNKDVLTQTDVLIVMRTTGPHDVRAIKEWVASKAEEGDAVIDSLPSLETGEAWVWNPERDILHRLKVRKRNTFDSSRTPKAGERRLEPREAAPIDLNALGQEIAATAERARENDPAELRKRIRELEAAAAKKGQPQVETRIETVEVPVLEKQLVEQLGRYLDDLRATTERGKAIADGVRELAGQLAIQLANAQRGAGAGRTDRAERAGAAAPAAQAPARRPAPAPPPPAPPGLGVGEVGVPSTNGRVSGPQQRILDALAWFEAIGVPAPRRSPLGAIAGASPKSSGFEKNLSTLRTNGLIDYPDRGRVFLTEDGRQAASVPAIPPTTDELHDAVCRMVSGPQAALLRALIAVYPDPLTRDELADAAGVSALSSGFEKNVSTLKSFELVDYPERGYVVALPVLFP